ncbi:branched-chain amino acid transport system II carrier protein [Myroides ceti]|uniref:Branched-chain amino acid transport system II carrier protein n=1 Tax=Paenimyroides ceti TaxID=395087 RepID=A0ABT8CZR3_9FLAO|nr:branched-chain amino acid transport system II carrier protein [Paenimyroides ceti]MDN3708685.1 branched-chain amino acid transport system II carrier protein [Paenimyroides ceti]
MGTDKTKSTLIFGLALFAMFFGAGNLLLPPFLGYQTGDNWWSSLAGFSFTGILAPIIATLSILKSGDYFTDLGKKSNQTLVYILATINLLCIGPLIAIPRTGASVYEVSVLPLIPDAQPVWVCIIFFAAVLILSISRKNIITVLGKVMTPILIALLLLLIIPGIFLGNLSAENYKMTADQSFLVGFQQGYQTMDFLGSLIFSVVIISAAKRYGYTHPEDKRKVVINAALIAGLCLLIIYAGLFYLGHRFEPTGDHVSRASFLIQISSRLFNNNGVYLISVIMILACLTTAIALTAGFARFFDRITKGRLGYQEGVILCTLVSIILAINGVETILDYAMGLLNFIYPIILVLVLFTFLFGNMVTSKGPILTAIIVTTVISFIRIFYEWNPEPNIKSILYSLPLVRYQLEWVIPAFISFGLAFLITRISK